MRRGIALLLLSIATSAVGLNAANRLSVKVSPAQALAPAFMRVQATVQPDAGNRSLRVVAQSDDFYRSTEVEIEGDRGPNVRVIEFAGLPSGLYHVDVVLMGNDGQRAAATAMIRVVPSPGHR
jgi:hypothetical protein